MTEKQKKHRSPNYPYIGLQEALERSLQIQQAGGIYPVSFNSVMSVWGYKPGTTSSVIAALKSFSLIEVTGEGDKRQVKVTEGARKILADHADRDSLVKQAALCPPLYRDLWTTFHDGLPPSNKIIRDHLVFDKHFNEKVVDGVIKDFRDTIAFANLSASDIVDGDGGETDGETGTLHDADPAKTNNSGGGTSGGTVKPVIPVLGKDTVFNITIDVLENGQINVTNGGTLTSETFAILGDVFKLKEKYGKEPPKASDETAAEYDFSTGEEPGRMN